MRRSPRLPAPIRVRASQEPPRSDPRPACRMATTRRDPGIVSREAAHAGREPCGTRPGAAGCVRGCGADGCGRTGDAPNTGGNGRGPGIAETFRTMRHGLAALTVMILPVAASAQAPITVAPLMPPIVQYPAQQPPAQTAPPGAQPVTPPPSTWLPQTTAMLQVLDKVNAQNSVLTVKVGQS